MDDYPREAVPGCRSRPPANCRWSVGAAVAIGAEFPALNVGPTSRRWRGRPKVHAQQGVPRVGGVARNTIVSWTRLVFRSESGSLITWAIAEWDIADVRR